MKRCRKCGLVAFGEEKSCRGCRSRSFDPIGYDEVTLADAIAYIKAMDGDKAYERDACLAALSDLAPRLEAERNALAIAFNCGAVGFLARGDVSSAMRLMDQAYLSPAISNQIVAVYTGNAALGQSGGSMGNAPTAASLRDRGLLLLGDGEVEKAGRYFERALDIDPHDAMSYLGKVMIAHGVATTAGLSSCDLDLSSPDFSHALQFAQGGDRDLVEGIRDSVEQARRDRAAAKACQEVQWLLEKGTIEGLETAASELEPHEGSKEADELLIEINRKLNAYKEAQKLVAKDTAADMKKAVGKLQTIANLTEAEELLANVQFKLSEYKSAQTLVAEGTVVSLQSAITMLWRISGLVEADKLRETVESQLRSYQEAHALISKNTVSDLEAAVKKLRPIKNVSDADELLKDVRRRLKSYQDAQLLVGKGTIADLEEAARKLKSEGIPKDAGELLSSVQSKLEDFEKARVLAERDTVTDLEGALQILDHLTDLREAVELQRDVGARLDVIRGQVYEDVQRLISDDNVLGLEKALQGLELIKGYKDVEDLAESARSRLDTYEDAKDLVAKKTAASLQAAVSQLSFIAGLEEADELREIAESQLQRYQEAQKLMAEGTIAALESAAGELEAITCLEEANVLWLDVQSRLQALRDVRDLVASGTITDLKSAAKKLKEIKGHKDEDVLDIQKKLEKARKRSYDAARAFASRKTIADLKQAVIRLETIEGYRDADSMLDDIQSKLREFEEIQLLLERGSIADLEEAVEKLELFRSYKEAENLLEVAQLKLEKALRSPRVKAQILFERASEGLDKAASKAVEASADLIDETAAKIKSVSKNMGKRNKASPLVLITDIGVVPGVHETDASLQCIIHNDSDQVIEEISFVVLCFDANGEQMPLFRPGDYFGLELECKCKQLSLRPHGSFSACAGQMGWEVDSSCVRNDVIYKYEIRNVRLKDSRA